MKVTCKNQAHSEAFDTNEKMSDENYFNKLPVEVSSKVNVFSTYLSIFSFINVI